MIGGDASPASRQHRLDVDCALAEVLLERVTPDSRPESEATAQRRREALNLIEQSELPTAVFTIANRTSRLVNAAWRALFGTRDAYTAIPGVDDTGRTGSTVHHAKLALDRDGRPAYVAATLRASRNELGATMCVIVVCVDITDEVVARELAVGADALAWSGPLACDADYFNQRWSRYAGPGVSFRQVIHPDDASKCSTGLAWAVRERGSTDVEVRVRRTDGDFRWHRIRFAISATGKRWTATAIDIHDARNATGERNALLALERAARADAEEANRLKDQFLAAVSHELRTPLTTIALWAAVLRNEASDSALRDRALEVIQQSVLVQSRVVGDMLDISRAINGKLYVDLRPVDVEHVVCAAFESIAPVALEKHIALDRRGLLVGGEVQGDVVRLRQVLDNLLSNAVKFTEPGGRVTVTASRRGRSIVIEVEDTGCGITPEFLPRLFEPFSQMDDPATRTSGGLGLGLAIAKRLVELHGGTLVASSQGLGCGAMLILTLPEAAARRTTLALVPRTPMLDHMRVLVIDDDHRVREALALLLDRAGAEVETAESAEVGRTRIAHRAPEAVVCDIAMPGEDGYSFISRLRSSGNDVVVIALTAHATEADAGRALAAGFDCHLAKPVDFERLVENIDQLVVAHREAARAP
jgi:signal transduction histidine kinase/ActR/RegA family two-component response regulator